ncbi:MAG: hypothetical protein AAF280_14170 [Pseudomonadota bacterium]
MALCLFIFASLCGIVAGFLVMMLAGIGWVGGVAVFFATTYGVVMLPLLLDLLLDRRGHQS